METSLHRTLKARYATDASQTEIKLGKYRIDAIDEAGRLVEVQHAGLGAIRDKIADLLKEHVVRVVKPIIANKWIVTLDPKKGTVQRRRRSPKRGYHLDIFTEMLHFTRVFPHPRLILEVPLIDVEETRRPKPKRWRRAKQYQVVDQTVLDVGDSLWLTEASDLFALVNAPADTTFDTAMLASWLERPRWFAQQTAYVLSRCGACVEAGKRGNNRLYKAAPVKAKRASTRKRKQAA